MFKIKRIDIDAGENTVIINDADAYEMGIRSLDRVKISSKNHTITAIVETSETVLKSSEVGLLARAYKDLQEEEGSEVDIELSPRPSSIEYIKKKMNGEELSKRKF